MTRPVRALVTGGASGIGAACARRLAATGALVLVADIDADAAASVARGIGERARACRLDVTDQRSATDAVALAVAELGGLDIAVNSAGVGMSRLAPVDELAFAEWRQVLGVDLDGLFLTMQAELTAMLAGGGGSIVNIASVMGIVGQAGASSYVAAKHGVIGLTKAAALDYASRGIRVNAVGPGHVATAMFDKWPPATRDQITKRYPAQRVADPEEVAELVAFLAGPAAGFATGGFYPIDGGYTAA